MTKKTASALKGIGAVMAVGGTAAMIGSAVTSTPSAKKKAKKTAAKALKTVNDIIDGVSGAIN